jgi:hypothetical protein
MPGEAVRLTIDLVRDWHPRPGCHVHMWMPRMSLWSSHPFSVAWASTLSPDSKEMTLPILEGDALMAPGAPQKSRQISLICRARTGMTRHMYERACKMPNEQFTAWGFIEGPYGGHHSLDSYGTVVLFAGGDDIGTLGTAGRKGRHRGRKQHRSDHDQAQHPLDGFGTPHW